MINFSKDEYELYKTMIVATMMHNDLLNEVEETKFSTAKRKDIFEKYVIKVGKAINFLNKNLTKHDREQGITGGINAISNNTKLSAENTKKPSSLSKRIKQTKNAKRASTGSKPRTRNYKSRKTNNSQSSFT